MSKFDSPVCEWLYNEWAPDDEVGDSSAGVGWAGKYTFEGVEGGVIIYEKTSGEVRMAEFSFSAELEISWLQTVELLDMNRPEPEEGDWVVQDTTGGYVASQNGQSMEFEGVRGIDPVLHYISSQMDRANFYPNVWHVNDHGNYTLLDLKEMGIRQTFG